MKGTLSAGGPGVRRNALRRRNLTVALRAPRSVLPSVTRTDRSPAQTAPEPAEQKPQGGITLAQADPNEAGSQDDMVSEHRTPPVGQYGASLFHDQDTGCSSCFP